MATRSGALILDVSCFAHLQHPSAMRQFRRNARMADLIPFISEVNLLEAVQAGEPTRSRLLETMQEIRDGWPVLPWTWQLAKLMGESILRGERALTLGDSGKEWVLDNPPEISDDRVRVLPFVAQLEQVFDDMHDRARQSMQRFIKAHGGTTPWSDSRDFLTSNWIEGGVREHFAGAIWRALGLPGAPPIPELLQNGVWSLLLDAEGVAIYERALARTMPKRAHRPDLLQIPYLGMASRRVLVTADKPFLRTAETMFRGRYVNIRAVHVSELLS
jgi:hypothetical protein